MGWETTAILGARAFSSMATMNTGQAQAKAEVTQAGYLAKNSADNTVRQTGKLQTSFLQSGLTLEGGPMEVLKQAFATGYTDIGRIAANGNAAAKNTINSARTKALESLASGAGALLPGASSFASGVSSGFNDAMTNAATYQTGATPGFSSSYGPFDQSSSLPWASDGLQVGKLYNGGNY